MSLLVLTQKTIRLTNTWFFLLLTLVLMLGMTSSVLAVNPTNISSEVWNTNQVLGQKGNYPFAGIYEFDELTIADNVKITSSGISQLVIKVNGTLTIGKNVTIRSRNGYYPEAPTTMISELDSNNLSTIGVDVGGYYLFETMFGKGGNGGNGGRGQSGYTGGSGGGGGAGGFGGGIGGEGGQMGTGTKLPGYAGGSGTDNGLGGGSAVGGNSGAKGFNDNVGGNGGNGKSLGNGGGGGGGNSGNGGKGTYSEYSAGNLYGGGGAGGGAGGYGGGILTVVANNIVYNPINPPKFLVSGQKGGAGNNGYSAGTDGQNGQGGLLVIQCPNYLASPNHWNLDFSDYGIHDPSSENGGHGVIRGNPQKVFINNWEYSVMGYKASGRVTGPSSGVSIPGVTLSFAIDSGTGNLPISVTTDANGNWNQSGFQIGATYKVTAQKDGNTFTPSEITFSAPNTALNFTGNGQTAPTVSSTDPASNVTGVPVNKTINVTFSGNVLTGNTYNSITLKNASGTAVATTNSINGSVLNIQPTANLAANTVYTITIPAGAVNDATEPYSPAGAYSFSFTTASSNATLNIATTTLPTGTQGLPYYAAITVGGGLAPYTWSATGLPTGLSIESTTGVISGTPTTDGTVTVPIIVTDSASNSASTSLSLTIGKPVVPNVTWISPASGAASGGTTVNITGTGFTGATAVMFGSALGTGLAVNGDTSITVTSPAGSGTVNVTVTGAGGTSTMGSNDIFTYTNQTVPDIVTNLSINNSTSNELDLTWSTVSGATSYKIYRSVSAAGTFTELGTSTTTSYSDKNLTTNTTYYYKVSAINANGEGLQSSAVTGTSTVYTEWVPVGNVGFSSSEVCSTSLYVFDGTPYVAYIDHANGQKATVMKFDGNNWVLVGSAGFSGEGDVSNISLNVSNGIPYVAYVGFGADGSKATVMKYDGSNWVTVGSADFCSNDISLNVSNGTPYVAYSDNANDFKAMVMKYDGSNWVAVGSAGFPSGGMYNKSLYVSDGTPYLAYNDGANGGKATVRKYDGNNWVLVGSAGFSCGEYGGAWNISLNISNGIPYVAYISYDVDGYKGTVMKYDGSNWVTVGSTGFSSYNISLNVSNGTPYVAYSDYFIDKGTVMKYNGSNWVTVGSADFFCYDISLDVSNGTPYVAYSDNANDYKTTVMKFDPFTPITETLTVSNPTNLGFTVAISPALAGLTASNFTLLDSSNHSVTITEAATSDSGATYSISAALSAGQTYTVTATDTGYTFGTAQSVVVPTASPLTPPSITADSAKLLGSAVNLTFSDSLAWRAAIMSITVDGTALTSSQYTVSAGNINIAASILTTAGNHTLVVTATAYTDAMVTQTMIDNISPVAITVTGVTEGQTYSAAVTPSWTDVAGTTSTATLDGAAYTKGTAVNANGAHTLVVTATKTANSLKAVTTVNFTINSTVPVKVTGITVTSAVNTLINGETLQMSAAVLPSNVTDPSVTWSIIPGTGSAMISSAGLVTATGSGTVTVKAIANDGSAVVGIEVITITNTNLPIKGDVNGDGMVNILDVVQAVNFALAKTTPTTAQFNAADINSDGFINILDAVQIVNKALGR